MNASEYTDRDAETEVEAEAEGHAINCYRPSIFDMALA